MKNLVLISTPNIKKVFETLFPDGINYTCTAAYFGELMNKYFSLGGFYSLKADENKKLHLKKLNEGVGPQSYGQIEIITPKSVSALENFVKEGVSLVKGNNLGNGEFKGKIKKEKENYSLEITEIEKYISF